MSQMTVKVQERGPSVKINIIVMRHHTNDNEMTTEQINIDDKAVVIVKLKAVTKPDNHDDIELKKSNDAKDSIVLLNITSDKCVKKFICNEEWINMFLNTKVYENYVQSCGYIFLYNIEIQMTVHVIMPVTSNTYTELYEDTEFTDFSLKVADGSIPVHKSVLFVQSEMYKGMLRGKWKETEEDSITMPGVSVQILEHLKDYMYLGTLPEEGCELLLLLAKRYLMDKLAEHCIDKLVKTVKPETFNALVDLACQNNIPELMKELFLRIPEDVVTGISQMYIANEEKT